MIEKFTKKIKDLCSTLKTFFSEKFEKISVWVKNAKETYSTNYFLPKNLKFFQEKKEKLKVWYNEKRVFLNEKIKKWQKKK